MKPLIITLNQIPPIPADSLFNLQKIDTVSLPHPYCITPKHIKIASDHFGGILDKAAIIEAEKRGAACDICRTSGTILSYDKHESLTTLFIEIPKEFQRDLNDCPGLHGYLFTNKGAMENLGIQGFAFPAKH